MNKQPPFGKGYDYDDEGRKVPLYRGDDTRYQYPGHVKGCAGLIVIIAGIVFITIVLLIIGCSTDKPSPDAPHPYSQKFNKWMLRVRVEASIMRVNPRNENFFYSHWKDGMTPRQAIKRWNECYDGGEP